MLDQSGPTGEFPGYVAGADAPAAAGEFPGFEPSADAPGAGDYTERRNGPAAAAADAQAAAEEEFEALAAAADVPEAVAATAKPVLPADAEVVAAPALGDVSGALGDAADAVGFDFYRTLAGGACAKVATPPGTTCGTLTLDFDAEVRALRWAPLSKR